MTAKKWAITLLFLVLVTTVCFGGTIRYIDPLLQYGKELPFLTYYESSEIYSNPGIAKNYDYDSILTGSSMVEQANVNTANNVFECTAIKVPYSGGSSYNFKRILDICFKSNSNIKTVFWSLDEYALTVDYMTPRYPLPEYLYDFKKTNDLSYLLNLDVFYFYVTKDVFYTLTKKSQPAMRSGPYTEDESGYSAKNMLATVAYPMEQTSTLGKNIYDKNLYENLEKNIIPLIEGNKNTVFKFFFPPYSIASWYQKKSGGTLDGELFVLETLMSKLTEYDNVEVYFFQADNDIITNLDNYKDYSHFKSEINDYMFYEMGKGSHRVTKNNYLKTVEDFRSYLTNFDYDAFFSDKMK